MIASNVAVCVPNKGCNKNCPYCVSRITGMMESNTELMKAHIRKVKKLADAAQVFCILLTGKGEPTCNIKMTEFLIEAFSEYSVELQTNGIILGNDLTYLGHLHTLGLNTIAISIDDLSDFNPDLLNAIHETGMLSRVSFNVTNKLHLKGCSYQDLSFHDLIGICKTAHVDQMTLRNIVVPNNTKRTKETQWIENNVDSSVYRKIEEQMIKSCEKDGQLIMQLPYGALVYGYEGIAVSYSQYCVQDHNKGEDIRSLIFQENGHCYTSWASEASKFGI
jgi:sulfatase maturation enzyme AslB (radical SAM superfamily)